MRLDLSPVLRGEQTIAEVAASVTPADLRQLTDEIIDRQRALIADAVDADVVFVPNDPEADDPGAEGEAANMGWTIGHVIVHATAGSEEGAAVALTLARGAPAEGRPRYETPWESIRTLDQVVQRLEESRRMRLAMLAAWPDEPHLDNSYTPIEQFGPMNAIARFLLGLMHEDGHLAQLADVLAQARTARST